MPAARDPAIDLAGAAAIPLVVYGADQYAIHLASGMEDPQHAMGHWILMGLYAFTVVLLAALAAWRVSGWRLNAWTAALRAMVLGLASLLVSAASALGTIWAVLAIVWGAAFITAAEVGARGRRVTPSGRPERQEVAPRQKW